ncbi:hypothetical protein RRU94_15715 [Domibacillus sp. DTU_2020_1001157_1_SI_ALB_TIR_016]|uniref:hypothetical protein n=1 Tax=Domibacillus sp. DTU_2020_1001157_1_SI_ALB_TIR_016 TaxID=3077789 RepID=UPI0028EFA319|nr:hypothetical protein [Domibacillus sp. DTU_2020_1001157_1_SI_ALB_TIR_016]WNS82193.1 hypothetical protein RRU94_15715 [Domibacillus sp. DTU_2020_1001157_1_SI_ALB_TIR_016]
MNETSVFILKIAALYQILADSTIYKWKNRDQHSSFEKVGASINPKRTENEQPAEGSQEASLAEIERQHKENEKD